MGNKNKFRSILSLLLCVCVVVTTMTFTFAVSADAEEVYFEDFEDFDVSSSFVEYGTSLGNGWSVAQGAGIALSQMPTGAIEEKNENKSLAFTGVSCNPDAYLNRQGIIHFQGKELKNLSSTYKIKFDFSKDSAASGFGIKFNLSPSKSDYYYLIIGGTESDELWKFYKVVADTKKVEIKSADKYKSATSSPGSFTDGTVEIIVDGGRLSWTITGTRYQNKKNNVSKGNYYDANPFTMSASECGIGFGAGFTSTAGSRIIRIDNLSLSNVKRYVDFDPAEMLYKNISQCQEVNEFDAAYPIRKIQALDLANQTVGIDFEGPTSSTNITATFDENGVWSNHEDFSLFNKVTMPSGFMYDDLAILTEVDGTELTDKMYLDDVRNVMYPVTGNELEPSNFKWTSSNPEVATVSNGRVKALKRGTSVITATLGDVAYTLTVNVMGEIDAAIEKNDIDGYIASKQPIINAINNAIATSDNEALTDILACTGTTKLSDIRDIDVKGITALSPSELSQFVSRIMTYDSIKLQDVEDVTSIQNLIDSELIVGKLNNLEDTSEIESLLTDNAKVLGINLENEFYIKNKQDSLEALCFHVFKNLKDVKDTFSEVYIIMSYHDAIGTTVVRNVITTCIDEIGVDKAKFEKVDDESLYSYLLKSKSSITTLASLKNAIETFVIPKSTPGSSGGNGSGGVTRGSTISSSADDSVIVSPDVKAQAEQPVEAASVTLFTDVTRDDWFYDYAEHLKGIKVINGYEDGTFKPAANVSRAEFVKMVMTACNIGDLTTKSVEDEEAEDEVIFEDVVPTDWYYKYMVEANKNGIVFGDTDSRCYPNDMITREEMSLILYRAALKMGKYISADNIDFSFTDEASISDWAYHAIISLKNSGFVSGDETGAFKPQSNATRAEVAALISKFLKTETVDPATLVVEESVEEADEK